jgi:hypothetical protein
VDILKGVEVLIGLAVTMLLASTVVTAVAQLYLSASYARARYLRDGLQQLVASLEPDLLGPISRYLAQRLIRHPQVGRRNTAFGWATSSLRNWFRQRKHQARQLAWSPGEELPLPVWQNPGEAIQREELVLSLLEWAADEGPLARQDTELSQAYSKDAAVRDKLAANREALRKALARRGVMDPAGTARAIRLLTVHNETVNPGQPAQVWRAQAIGQMPPNDVSGKVFAWFDNSVARMTDDFGLEAKVVTSVIALVLVFALQLDSIALLRRLSEDDALRKSLVDQHQKALQLYEETRQALGDAEAEAGAPPSPASSAPPAAQAPSPAASPRAEPEKDSRQAELKQRTEEAVKHSQQALEALRDPKLAIVPGYFLWNRVAQAQLCQTALLPLGPEADLRLVAGAAAYPLKVRVEAGQLEPLTQAIATSGAPVAVLADECHDGKPGLRLVARRTDIPRVALLHRGDLAVTEERGRQRDWLGFWSRLPGVLFAWILLSLGAPFWYDLLKKLIDFRSLILRKDDQDRKNREKEQTAASSVAQQAARPPAGLATPSLEGPPGVVATVQDADLRYLPNASASVVRVVPAGTLVSVAGSVKGDALPEASGTGNDRWYRTLDGEFLWAGATDKPKP